MKNRFFKKARQILASVVAIAMIVTMLPATPIMAEEANEKYPYTLFAASEAEGAISVDGNLCVNGNVATNGTIVVGGNANINGTKAEHAGEEMIYILSKLESLYFAEDSVEIYSEGYSSEEVNNNFSNPLAVQGKVEVKGNVNLNAPMKATEDIVFDVDSINANNAVLFSENGDIVIDGNNVNLNGLVYAPEGDVIITAQNLNLNNIIVIADTITFHSGNVNANYNHSIAEMVGETSEQNPDDNQDGEQDTEDEQEESDRSQPETTQLYFTGKYEGDPNSILLEWYTNAPDDTVTILSSQDNVNYTKEAVVSDATSYRYQLPEQFVTKYLKASVTSDTGEILETSPFVITKTEEGYGLQMLDTDNDGVADEFELLAGTDINNPDTDGDGLTDYEELYPQELPIVKEEIDKENKVEQSISAESEVFAEINTEDNPYRISLDIKAAGDAEENLTVKETGYSRVIENEFMLGIAAELSYAYEDCVEAVTLTFEIEEEAIENSIGLFPEVEELSGIKRFNVFKYFEDVNMLLPIETKFDVENNRIFATTDELGTYCVMDMELWMASFEVPEEVYKTTPMLLSLELEDEAEEFTEEDMRITSDDITEEVVELEEIVTEAVEEQDVPMLFSLNRASTTIPVDVAFLLQTAGDNAAAFSSQKGLIVNVLSALNEKYGEGNVRFVIITYGLQGSQILNTEENGNWFSNEKELETVLDTIVYQDTFVHVNRGAAFEKLLREVDFRESAAKFIFQVMNGASTVGSGYFDQIETCAKLEINYSEIKLPGYDYISAAYRQEVANAIASTNGMNTVFGSSTPQDVYNHVCKYLGTPRVEFEAIVATGWKQIVLEDVLDELNGANSDTDSLTDWQEVDVYRVNWETDGTIVLPTVQECIDFIETPYAEDGLARYKESLQIPGMPTSDFAKYLDYVLNNVYVLPVFSDPCDPDSDGDGLEDDLERTLGTDALDIDTDDDLLDDEEEYLVELDPLWYDTDGDLLNDGLEYVLGYDPYDPNPDGDAYTDYEEYFSGTDPFVYEYVKSFFEHVADIGYGVLWGDFVDDDEVDTDVLIGQIGGSFIPIVGDARDFVANVIKGDFFMAAMSVVGLVPIGGDAAKTAANLGEAIVKLGDDVPAVTKLVLEVAEEHPGIVKYMAESKEITEAIKNAVKSPKITKETLEKIVKYADEAGIAINKTSDLFGEADNVVDGIKGVWSEDYFVRGKLIDDFCSNHKGNVIGNERIGLGETFPIVDSLEGDVLISTKSIDLGTNSYKKPSVIKGRIKEYLKDLDNLENKYRKISEDPEGYSWRGVTLKSSQYKSKVLEIIIPDIPITPEQAKVIQGYIDESFNGIKIRIKIMRG